MSADVLLVTGGSRGIGEAVAVLGAQRGYDIVLSFVNQGERAAAVVKRIEMAGGRALAVQADTAQEADIERLFIAADGMGRLAALVYNAGITGPNSPLAEASTATIDAVLDVNLRGAMLCCRSAIRRMSTRLGGLGGAIVLLSSRATFYGSPNEFVWYAASKGGIDSLNNGLARELGAEGIRVNAVSPGPIVTEMHRPGKLEGMQKRAPLQRAGTPEETAEAVLFLASSAASYITGANLAVAGGM
jgi:NAD(P)-dependent dehydrogenase (short-subunit alcohol dehydrogenase family)